MTDTKTLREAAVMALEALILNNATWKMLADSGDCGNWNAEDQDHYVQTEAAIAALRASLALLDEPVAWNISYTSADGSIRTVTHGHNAIADYRQFDPNAISTPIYAAPQSTAEPAACDECGGDGIVLGSQSVWACPKCSVAPQPATVERKPLTDEQIQAWWASDNGLENCDIRFSGDFWRMVRAVEEKHGIQGAA